MSQHLTAHLIAEALDASGYLLSVQPAEGWDCEAAFIHKGDGELSVTLYDTEGLEQDGIETRTFRLVEVEP